MVLALSEHTAAKLFVHGRATTVNERMTESLERDHVAEGQD
jgi:hypothetical protein